MARVAPAAWGFWAMPQAMERLLASPKTTAVLPARLIMLSCSSTARVQFGKMPGRPSSRLTVTFRDSAAEVDEFDSADGATKETGAEAFKLFYRVAGEPSDRSG